MSELRYRAVLEVLDGAVISTVARRYGVSRQTVHAWLRRYARDGAVLNLARIIPTISPPTGSAGCECDDMVHPRAGCSAVDEDGVPDPGHL